MSIYDWWRNRNQPDSHIKIEEPPMKPTSVQRRFCKICKHETMQVRLVERLSRRINWLCRECGNMVIGI